MTVLLKMALFNIFVVDYFYHQQSLKSETLHRSEMYKCSKETFFYSGRMN